MSEPQGPGAPALSDEARRSGAAQAPAGTTPRYTQQQRPEYQISRIQQQQQKAQQQQQ